MNDFKPDIARLRALDDAEWLAVERAYAGRLMAFAARRVADATAREDILQETFLGAVRGIESFDSAYTFEQFLFGICRNRTIDHLRRARSALPLSAGADDERGAPIERLAREEQTPSRLVRRQDLARAGQALLEEVLRRWVQETWSQQEFTRLMVIEALLCAGWRNRDTWQRLSLRDETAVAGIKFRALRRLRELAAEVDPRRALLPDVADALGDEPLALDVGRAWRAARVACPARHWLARSVAGTLAPGPESFLRFHLEQVGCEWCQANRDDLARAEPERTLDPLIGRVGASTLKYLRSRARPAPGTAPPDTRGEPPGAIGG